jgi:hypothetical protein
MAYNFLKKEELEHNLPLYKKYGLHKKYYSPISSEDFKSIESPQNLYDKLDSKTEMPKQPQFEHFDADTQKALLAWSDNGYAILRSFFSGEEIDQFNAEVDKLIDSKEANWRYQNKIMFAIHKSQVLKSAGEHEKLIDILSFLLHKKVGLFQSINFLTGSQQRTHSDTIHMTTFPYGNLIAVWVALEDISADSGPLHYYPGTHKLPYVLNADYGNVGNSIKLGDKLYNHYEDKIEDVVKESGVEKQIFLAKKGDILIWHANLLHGGEPQTNPEITRKSMVFHYYAEDSICFHEITQRPTLKKKV